MHPLQDPCGISGSCNGERKQFSAKKTVITGTSQISNAVTTTAGIQCVTEKTNICNFYSSSPIIVTPHTTRPKSPILLWATRTRMSVSDFRVSLLCKE